MIMDLNFKTHIELTEGYIPTGSQHTLHILIYEVINSMVVRKKRGAGRRQGRRQLSKTQPHYNVFLPDEQELTNESTR